LSGSHHGKIILLLPERQPLANQQPHKPPKHAIFFLIRPYTPTKKQGILLDTLFFAVGVTRLETKLQIFRAAHCWENLGESPGGAFDS